VGIFLCYHFAENRPTSSCVLLMCGGGVEVVALAGNHALVGSRTAVALFFVLKQFC